MRSTNDESGMILPMVVIFMLFVTITGLAFLNMTVMEHNLAMAEVHKTQAFYLAEGGVEHARVKLGDNWDLASIDETPLGAGTYIVDIYETDIEDAPLDPDNDSKRRIRSTGIVKKVSQIVQVIVKKPPSDAEVIAPLESGGIVEITGDATIIGNPDSGVAVIAKGETVPKAAAIVTGEIINKDPSSFENDFWPYDDYFEQIFKMSREDVKNLAKKGDNKYYPAPPTKKEDLQMQAITWIDDPNQEGFQITYDGWEGQGLLVMNGDMKMTGGTFNGVIWVTGGLTIPGNTLINGAVFVEGKTEIQKTAIGTMDLIYNSDAVDQALGKIATIPFIQLGTWEQLK